MDLERDKTLGVADDNEPAPSTDDGDDGHLRDGNDAPNAGEDELLAAITKISDGLDADIYLYNGPIIRDNDRLLIDTIAECKAHSNVMLILVTQGGDPDAAYRIARAFQRAYKKFICYVPGWCKSAGTLVAIGATELVICDHGELGPLDIQMIKKDELAEMESGAVVFTAMETLYERAFDAFEHFFLLTLKRSLYSIRTQTAARIATDLTAGLFGPVCQQIDPTHIGEAGREMRIATYYGNLLDRFSKNLKPRALERLVSHFPTHGFVIDREEAEQLFRNVRAPSDAEQQIATLLGDFSRDPIGKHNGEPMILVLTSAEFAETMEVGSVDDEADEAS